MPGEGEMARYRRGGQTGTLLLNATARRWADISARRLWRVINAQGNCGVTSVYRRVVSLFRGMKMTAGRVLYHVLCRNHHAGEYGNAVAVCVVKFK